MDRPMDKLADVLASITLAEEALLAHAPQTCRACAEAQASPTYLVCGEERDWTTYLTQLLEQARVLLAAALVEAEAHLNEDEEDLLQVAAPMLDSYRGAFKHRCPECRGGTWCPEFSKLRASAREASVPVQRIGSRILARACS